MFLFPKFTRLRVPAQHADGTVKVQRVRISKGRGRPLAATVLALPLTLLLLETSEHWLPDEYKTAIQKARTKIPEDKIGTPRQQDTKKVKKPEDGLKERTAREWGEATRKKARPQDIAFFIPLPYFRKRRPEPYKKNDKEWIEATKLYADSSRRAKLKTLIIDETIRMWARDKNTMACIHQVSDNFGDSRHFSEKGAKGRLEAYLDVVVPLHRPPTFEQPGIIFPPDGARLAWRPLSNRVGARINRTLHPTVFFEAFWNAGVVLTHATYQSIRNRVQGTGPRRTSIFSSPTSSQTAAATPSPSTGKSGTSPRSASDAVDKKDDAVMASFRQLTKTVTPELPLAQAKQAFLQTFSALQIQALQQVPEGAVVFQGYITFVGIRGKVRSTISAIYLPAQDRLICPIILERTEVLPKPGMWYESDFRRFKISRSDAGEGPLDGEPTPEKTKQFQQNVLRYAKLMEDFQKSFDDTARTHNKRLEEQRQQLAKAIAELEDQMSGHAPQAVKDLATAKVQYVKMRKSEAQKVEPAEPPVEVKKEAQKEVGSGDGSGKSAVRVEKDVSKGVGKSDDGNKSDPSTLEIPKPEEHKKKEE